MSRVGLPSPRMRLATDDGIMTPEYYQFLTDLYQNSGLAGSNFPLQQDAVVTGASMRADATNPPGFDAFGSSTRAFAFDSSVNEYLHFIIQLPHGYTERTRLAPFLQWSPKIGSAGGVVWVLNYSWAKVDGTFTADASVTVTATSSGTALKHQYVEFDAIEAGEQGVSSVLVCRVYRNATDTADTYASDAYLLSCGVHFQNAAHGTTKRWP